MSTTTVLPPLPAGWHHAEHAPRLPDPAPPQSGPITAVTGATGHEVTLHRAEYTAPSPQGVATEHGYAWCCTNPDCRRVTLGYPPQGFGRAYGDARAHHCEEPHRA